MRIEVHLLNQSQPIEYKDVQNAYTKDGMYCMLLEYSEVIKFPMVNIFRVKEFADDYEIIKQENTYDFEDLKLDGELTVCDKEIILIPREIFDDVLELNNLDIEDSDDFNTIIGDDVIINVID